MKLAAVTVLFNPKETVKENVKSYLDSVERLYAIDNSSKDNSSMFDDEKIVYIPNNKNLGIATALNIGARKAIEDGFDWILTMDQDSQFSSDGVGKMKQFYHYVETNDCAALLFGIEPSNVGIITPFHLTPTDTLDIPRGFGFADVAMTSGNLVNLAAYSKAGGFADDYFIDAVDFDFCLKLRENKFDIVTLNYIQLIHGLGDPVIKRILGKRLYSLNHNYIRRYYIVRNRHYLYDTYKDKFPGFADAEKRRTLIEAIKIILLEKEKYIKLRSMYRGYKDYKKGIKGEMPSKYIIK